jgi:sulfur relay (sulfurtransferase) complex TusBCD TusD component (DsrE family)
VSSEPTTPVRKILSSAKKHYLKRDFKWVFPPWNCTPLAFFAAVALGATALSASAQTQSSVTLEWNALTNSNVAGYRLYQGAGSRLYSSSVTAGTATQRTVNNLTAGATYYFALTAYNAAGVESDYSVELAYTVPNSTNSSLLPVVTLTAPASGSTYLAPATINLAASVTANGHIISKVQFYQGSTLLGESPTAPYSYTWSGATAGTFNISARVIYDAILSASSSGTTVIVTNSVPNPPVGGLVAAYGFDEGAGATVSDASGSGNTGSINAATWITTGRFGNALAFNGSSSAVVVNDSASLDLTTGMTLEAWVYPTGLANWHDIIYKGDDLYYLEASTPLTAGPSVGFGDSGALPMLSAPTALSVGTWSHVAATYNGATLRLFVNGVLVASRAQTGSIAISGLPLTIGADTIHGSYYYGVIDEVRIYNRALTTAEIQSDMNSAVSGGGGPSTPPAVVMSSPTDGSAFAAPANVTLGAAVTANGHTINKVQFFSGFNLLGEDLSAPYSLVWSNVAAASYLVTARVTYDGGLTTDSAGVSISVTNPNPAVALSAPLSGATYVAPATVPMLASVTANGHPIIKVQFYNDSTLLGEASTAPYAFTWSNVGAGNYTLKSTVVYDAGTTMDSAPITISVTNPPPQIAFASPASGATYQAPAAVAMSVSVAPNGHSIDKVQYYNGSALLGEALMAPFDFIATGLPAGQYALSARALYDGTSAVDSGIVSVSVTNPPPAITMTSPVSGSTDVAPATLTVAADVTANGHTILRVRFFDGTNLVGQALSSPYTFTWTNVPAGDYALTARALYDTGSTVDSGIVSVSVTNPPPVVTMTSPVSGSATVAPAALILAADVVTNGHVLTKVQFLSRGSAVGESSNFPYTYTWNNVPAGDYTLVARAFYDGGSVVDSEIVSVSVTNPPPVVTMTSPTDGLSTAAPATLTLAADVIANGYSLTKVQFFAGSVLIGESFSSPYLFAWTNVSAGNYTLRARALYDGSNPIDSGIVSVSVTNPPPAITLTSPVSDSTNYAPATLTLAANVTANGHNVAKVQFFNDTNLVGEATSSPYSFTWTNVPAGNYTLGAQLIYDGSSTLASDPVSVTILDLPSPWESMDIGSVPGAGSVVFSNGMFTVKGSGNFNSTYDNFRFLFQPLSGDGEIVAKIPSADDGQGTALAGAMIRESLTPDSRYAFIGTASDKLRRQRRNVTGGASTFNSWANSKMPDLWVRLVRAGDLITRYESDDGVNWGFTDTRAIPMASEIYIGLAVASESSTNQTTATFSNIRVVP